MPGKIKNILIIANSARMLAQSANDIGYQALCIDCFSDDDTQLLALDLIKVDSLALNYVKPAFLALANQHTITHFIYGSGLDSHRNTFEFLHQHLIALGNDLAVFSAVQNKAYFFSELNKLKIPYPQTVFKQPIDSKNWLLKPKAGEGGLAIKQWDTLDQDDSHSHYWQKYIVGIPMSVLFIANSQQYKIIGFQQQLVTPIADYPFVFSGVISQPEVDNEIQQIVNQWLKKIVFKFALKGLNSLDFMVKDKQYYALEINARPSASMQLYDDSLLSSHINCFIADNLDSGLDNMLPIKIYQAYQIVFAEMTVEINSKTKWPCWCVDIPKMGSIIHTGMPICSIIARDKNEQQIKDLLLLRQQEIKQLLL
ncbi:MAG: ATP-grasp domain-containing protein [Methylococcales bacterium]|nr:ATP-grasp domain-containing protein [Methylococcales bacterium]